MPISSLERYSRQVLFAGIGAEGQQRLANPASSWSVAEPPDQPPPECWRAPEWVSCASSTATTLSPATCSARCLFDEADAAESLPKAIAAARKIAGL